MATLAGGRAAMIAQTAATTGCGGALHSRWSAAGAHYERTAVFGLDDDDYLESVAGITVSPGGRVIVYDGRGSRVFVLDQQLNVRTRFGRKGHGPGELSAVPTSKLGPSRGNYVAASDSFVYVYDGTAVKAFRTRGQFVRGYSDVYGPPFWFTVQAISATTAGALYGYDSVTFAAHPRRRLQTWSVNPAGKKLLYELPVVMPPSSEGGYQIPFSQAQPVWAGAGYCVVMGDGSSRWLLRLNLNTLRVDTLRLPDHSVAASAGKDDFDKLRKMGLLRSKAARPTAVRRWSEVLLDPDGHTWVLPWQDETARPPYLVYRIDPTGRLHDERVPAFPRAFGAPGVYFASMLDTNTDQVIIGRFDRRR